MLADKFWSGKPCVKGPRDQVVVDGDVVGYLLWGNEIAKWDCRSNVLTVSDCGWQTMLTKDRLNAIISRLDLSIYAERLTWFLHDRRRGATYYWDRTHTIDNNRQVTPCRPRTFRKNVSSSLLRYYDKARRLIEKRRFLAVVTLDGVKSFLFASRYSPSSVLCLRVSDSGLVAYRKMIPSSKVYSAFVRNDGASIATYVVEHGYKLGGVKEILDELERLEVHVNALPDEVASQLALAKLLEG